MTVQAFHPLLSDLPRPERFTYPFCYEPHPLCQAAATEVQLYIEAQNCWKEEISQGKMFGVLIAEEEGQLGYLAAYSGQLGGRNDWPFFVPAVYDMLQPDGHFKTGEREISEINNEIKALEQDDGKRRLTDSLKSIHEDAIQAVNSYKQLMEDAKLKRDSIRQAGVLSAEKEAELIKESQFMKAELRRIKKRFKDKEDCIRSQLNDIDTKTERLKQLRRQRSDQLQQWLFEQFKMLNALGEERNLIDIFDHAVGHIPPSGAGECCAPKLLQYAFKNNLRPVCMAEFWWGTSPKAEIRHHLHYYPACRGKCKPILEYMLQGLVVDPNPLDVYREHNIETVYDDDTLTVICKPAGMLSVPGKGDLPSVLSEMQRKYPEAEGPMIVHRLDMDTSGLLIVAKTTQAYLDLQQQFCNHSIRKRYVALLTRKPDRPDNGTIDLPLCPDIADRPRQTVDWQHGKTAITEYHIRKVLDNGMVAVDLYPHTGRTHQLRVHCAHQSGLGTPIVGDRLYGYSDKRMYLHAEQIEFTHPATGQRMTFERLADFL